MRFFKAIIVLAAATFLPVILTAQTGDPPAVETSGAPSAVPSLTPEVSVSAVDLSSPGGLSEGEVKAAVEQGAAGFLACYEALLAESPEAEGSVQPSFSINEDGMPTRVSTAAASIEDEAFQDCVIEALMALDLGAPPKGRARAAVTLSFALTAPEPPPAADGDAGSADPDGTAAGESGGTATTAEPEAPAVTVGLTVGDIESEGILTPDGLTGLLNDKGTELGACYAEVLGSDPGREIAVTLKLEARGGKAETVRALSSDSGEAAADTCLTGAVKALDFSTLGSRRGAGVVKLRFAVDGGAEEPGTAEHGDEAMGGGGTAEDLGAVGGGGRAPGETAVELETPVVRGGLEAEPVRRVLAQHLAEIDSCLAPAIDQGASGALTVVFTVDQEGNVAEPSVDADSIGNSEAAACVAAQHTRFRFPKPDGGGMVMVRATYSLPE